MNRKVFIIYSSEIFRKGLATIIRNYFNIEVIQLSSVTDLKTYQNISNNIVIIFYEADKGSEYHLINKLRKNNNTVKIVGVFSEKESTASDFNFDFSISIKTSSLTIREIVSDILKLPVVLVRKHEELTNREKDVLTLVALGHSNKEIANKLFISTHTVISHRKNITEKLGIKSISGLTVYAILNKFIDTEKIDPKSLI